MALSASTVWEVRTTGSDSNGGGFVTGASGTDYSQQNAAQASGSDLAVDATTNTKVTSASHNFVAADVGNIIQIAAGTGWTAGFYQIVSVASNAATLDRSPAATSAIGGTWAEGGALATPGKAAGAMVAENTVFLKYSVFNYVLTTSSANVSGGPFVPDVGDQVKFSSLVGYDTTRAVNNTDANRPTIQVPSSGVSSITVVGPIATNQYWRVQNLIVDGQGKSSVTAFGGASTNSFRNCKALNCTAGFATWAYNCEASGCGTGFFGYSYACTAHGGSGSGFTGQSQNCLSYGNVTGFSVSDSTVTSCVAFGNSGNGFFSAYARGVIYIGCIASQNGGYGFTTDGIGGPQLQLLLCASFSNTSGRSSLLAGTDQDISPITLTADPFTNAASGDFSLNDTPGGGAACRAAGFPGAFPGGTTTGYLDLGAVQHADPTPPTTPALAITDNGDGTGATATISGSSAGSVNTVYTSPVPLTTGNVSWTASGSRTGDGTVSLSLTPGPYLAYCESALNGLNAAPSNEVFFKATGSTIIYESTHAALAAQVQQIIQGMLGTSIVGPAPESIRVRKTAYLGDFSGKNPLPANYAYSLPGIVICYFDVEDVADATNARDEIGYPITIVFAQETQSAATPSEANADQFLRWREAVERTFTHLRGCPNQIINATANSLNYQFFDCRMKGGLIIDPDRSIDKKIDVGWIKLSFLVWRGKNGT